MRIKIMAATLGMKYKSETILEGIRGLVFDFVLYFVTIWQSTLYMKLQHRVQHHMVSTKC